MRKIFIIILFLLLAAAGLSAAKLVHNKINRSIVSPVSNITPREVLKNLLGTEVLETAQALTASVSGVRVIFPKNGEFESLIRTLQTVLDRATMEGKAAEIDLRFDKPVIRYGTGSGNISN